MTRQTERLVKIRAEYRAACRECDRQHGADGAARRVLALHREMAELERTVQRAEREISRYA